MNRVFITGAGGFVGRHCVPALVARGFEVHAASRRPQGESEHGIHWHTVDLFDPERLHATLAEVRPTHLLHLAWTTTPGEYWNSPENLRWVEASLELCRRFADCGGRRAVMAGSCAEYDPRFGRCDEQTTPLRPETLYGAMKHALHLVCEPLLRKRGISLAWCRLFFMYGPGENSRRLVPQVIDALQAGRCAHTTHGRQIRDYLHVADAAAALVAVLESDAAGSINVASGVPVEVRQVIGGIAEILGRSDRVQLGTVPANPDEPDSIIANVSRVRDEVGWRPQFNLASGLLDAVSKRHVDLERFAA